jgi:uncharacterized RDD family membrane protein YckC
MNDDLQFRPMSKGLGFHHTKDTKSTLSLGNAISSTANLPPTKKPMTTQPSTLSQQKPKLFNTSIINQNTSSNVLKKSSSLAKTSLLSELENEVNDQNSLASSITKNPSLITRFSSWLIDITALTILMGLSSMLIFQLNNFSWDEPIQFFQMDFFWNLYLPLGIGFYLFYFMLFERVTGQTLGKLLMGIKVVKLNSDNPPSLVQCFLRNFFNIFSFATLGLLTVYDVVNWSLGLKVVKTKN